MNNHIAVRSFTSLLASLLLAACGGGGGSSGATSPPPMNQAVGGIWRFTDDTYSRSQVSYIRGVALVAENGQLFGLSRDKTNGCADVRIGSISAIGSEFDGAAKFAYVSLGFAPDITPGGRCSFLDGATSASELIFGSVTQRNSLTLTGKAKTSLGNGYWGSEVTAAFDSLYNTASSLAAISGNWTGPSGVVMNINSDGVIFAQDPTSGCVVNGQVSLINASYNAYEVSATYANCTGAASGLNGVTASGLAAVDSVAVPNLLYVGYSATVAGKTFIVAAIASR